MEYLSVGQVADLLQERHKTEVKPSTITMMFYNRVLDPNIGLMVSGRRLIPESYVETIEIELRRAGKLPTRR